MSRPEALQDFLRDADRLPVMPEVTMRLLGTLDAPDASAQDLATIVEGDPSLAVRLLKVANSSFYGQRGRVATVRGAVVVLGSKTLRSLALAVWTQTLRAQARLGAEAAVVGPLLVHGLTAGVAAGMLMERVERGLAEDAFMAGLLHDIGRVALAFHLGEAYGPRILGPAERDGLLLHEREAAVLGFDHRAVGAALMDAWGLPPFLGDVAEGHHDLDLVPRDRMLVATAALADDLATRLQANLGLGTPRPLRDDLAAAFGLGEPTVLAAFLDACSERVGLLREALD